MQTLGYGVNGAEDKVHSMEIHRRHVLDHDVEIDILYCGVCHSDIHQARNEWKNSIYPMVPGHEIVGKVSKIGSKVTKFDVGQLAGVGCFVDSCRECHECKDHQENFCEKGMTMTYNCYEKDKKTLTFGGYSSRIVVDENYVIKVSNKFTKLDAIAPLLCAGITCYSPLRAHPTKVAPGKKVGVIGLGGLGHMAVKFAVSMGADVTVFSTSSNKESDARRLGAKFFIISKDGEQMKKARGTLDFIIDTVSSTHDLMQYIDTLATHGVCCLVGAPSEPFSLPAVPLLFGNKTIFGSLIGGIKETQEMMDYCAEHDIVSDVEVITPDRIEEAFERTLKSDVKFRFVIDMKAAKK